jgi:hypothetical protein
MSFFGFAGAELSLTNTLTVGSAGTSATSSASKPAAVRPETSWLESISVEWIAPSPNSLLGIFYLWLADKVQNNASWPALSNLAASEFERLRKETLALVLDSSPNVFRTQVILGHESIIRILGRLYLSVFENLAASHNTSAETLSFTGSIGLSLHAIF